MSDNSEERIRLLIVDDIAETRENIRKLLQFEPDIVVVGTARTGEEAIRVAHDTQPDVVLMDINMPDMNGIKATEAILEDIPFTQIVILSVQNEPDYMRKAMLAGARDFIAKPPSGDELISTIRFVSKRVKEQREKLKKAAAMSAPVISGDGQYADMRPEGKLLVVYSPKGGVGCTTLATNLAVGLTTDDTPVALVDANFQFGDVSVFMNLQAKNSILDLASRVDELDQHIVNEVLMKHECGLHVLAAPPQPEMADEVQAEQFRAVLAFLRKQFAYIIVDTSSTMDDVTLAALDLSDVLMAVATTDIPSIKDTRLLLDLLSILEYPRESIMMVLNKTDRRTGITAEKISENLKHPIVGEISIDERTITASVNRGVPLLLGDRSRPIAKEMMDLLATVKEWLMAEGEGEEEERTPERSRIFGR